MMIINMIENSRKFKRTAEVNLPCSVIKPVPKFIYSCLGQILQSHLMSCYESPSTTKGWPWVLWKWFNMYINEILEKFCSYKSMTWKAVLCASPLSNQPMWVSPTINTSIKNPSSSQWGLRCSSLISFRCNIGYSSKLWTGIPLSLGGVNLVGPFRKDWGSGIPG